jgi:hypothetical protein
MGLSQPKSRAWIQQFNNCLGIAMKLADDNGYHVDMASIERQIEKASEFAAAKTGHVPWLNKPSPKLLESPFFRRMWENPTKPSSTAHILIRQSQGSEEQFMKHASFEHFGKEFNFGAAGPQWPISLRIPLKRKMPVAKSNGGMIYANNGMLIPYQPRGTDTVPAMLTPGEFVVNRQATQQNLPLLQSINGGATHMSRGGSVYLANGGLAGSGGEASNFGQIFITLSQTTTKFTNSLELAISKLSEYQKQLSSTTTNSVSNNNGSNTLNMDGLSQFTSALNNLIGQFAQIKIPEQVSLQGTHRVDVVINGASVFANMQEPIQRMIVTEVDKAMNNLSRKTEGVL